MRQQINLLGKTVTPMSTAQMLSLDMSPMSTALSQVWTSKHPQQEEPAPGLEAANTTLQAFTQDQVPPPAACPWEMSHPKHLQAQ